MGIQCVMIGRKYGAVIGLKMLITCTQTKYLYIASFLANHSAVFPRDHRITKFRQMTL